MSAYSSIKSTYKAVVPRRMRHAIYNIAPLRPLRNATIRRLERTAEHDEIYDQSYYSEVVDPYMKKSASVMASSIASTFRPGSIVDVGCGTGLLLLALGDHGVSELKGFDYSKAALDICRTRGLDVDQLDLEADPIPAVRADLVVSTEVAEHLPESAADHFLDTLASISDQIVLTAAEPAASGIQGTDHVNEQPHEYWIEKLKQRGYSYNQPVTNRWRDEWTRADVEACYAQNIMVFARES